MNDLYLAIDGSNDDKEVKEFFLRGGYLLVYRIGESKNIWRKRFSNFQSMQDFYLNKYFNQLGYYYKSSSGLSKLNSFIA